MVVGLGVFIGVVTGCSMLIVVIIVINTVVLLIFDGIDLTTHEWRSGDA